MQQMHTAMKTGKFTLKWEIKTISEYFTIDHKSLNSSIFEVDEGDEHHFMLKFTFGSPSSIELCWKYFPSSTIKYQLYTINDEERKGQEVTGIAHNTSDSKMASCWCSDEKLEINDEFVKELSNDILTVGCDVVAYYKPTNIMTTYERKLSISIADRIAEAYGTKNGTDFTFSVDNQLFEVHTSILSFRSPVFKRLFEKKILEKSANEIINNIRPEIFKLLIEFIYIDRAELLNERDTMELFTAADDYQIDDLKEYCFESLSKLLNVMNVKRVEFFAQEHNNDQLLAYVSRFVDENKDMIVDSNGMNDSVPPLIG